jgi:hypothetical protein
MFRIKLWGIILLCLALNCTRDKPARFERATSEGMQAMAARPEFLLAIVIRTVLVTWWVLSGFPGMFFRHFATVLFLLDPLPNRGSRSHDRSGFRSAMLSTARVRT